MALVHVIRNGDEIDAKHVGTDGVHRDESDTLWLDERQLNRGNDLIGGDRGDHLLRAMGQPAGARPSTASSTGFVMGGSWRVRDRSAADQSSRR